MNSKAIGERTEGIILGHLMKLGYVVLMPFGNNQRYDIVVDLGDGKFLRGQCKTAVYQEGCVIFRPCSVNGFTGAKRGYRGQVDVFWIYCPPLDTIYQVPVDKVGESQVNLRVDQPKRRSPVSTIRWASEFLI